MLAPSTNRSTTSTEIDLPFLKRNKLKYLLQMEQQLDKPRAFRALEPEQPSWPYPARRLRIRSKIGENLVTYTTDQFICPVCNKTFNLRMACMIQAHLNVAHPLYKYYVKYLPENNEGIVAEIYVELGTRGGTHVLSKVKSDKLVPGEDRFLFAGRPWRKRRIVECTPSAVSEKALEPPTKRPRFTELIHDPSNFSALSSPKDSSFLSERTGASDSQLPANTLWQGKESGDTSRPIEPSLGRQSHPAAGPEISLEKSRNKAHDSTSRNHDERSANSKGTTHSDSNSSLFPSSIGALPSNPESLKPAHELDQQPAPKPQIKKHDAPIDYIIFSLKVRQWAADLEGQALDAAKREAQPCLDDQESLISTVQSLADHVEKLDAIREQFRLAVNSDAPADQHSENEDGHGYTRPRSELTPVNVDQGVEHAEESNEKHREQLVPEDPEDTSPPFTGRRGSLMTDTATADDLKSTTTPSGSNEPSAGEGDVPDRSSSVENVNPHGEDPNSGRVLRPNRLSLERLSLRRLSKLSVNRLNNVILPKPKSTDLTPPSKPASGTEHPESQPTPADKPISSPPTIPTALPARLRKKYKVPAPPAGVTFFTSITKRPLVPGEELSESDDNGDDDHAQAWLALKQDQLIDRLRGPSPAAKELMKQWNAHFRRERVPSDRFFADAFVRFTVAHAAFIRRIDIWPEFRRKQAELLDEGLIGQAHVVRTSNVAKARLIPPDGNGKKPVLGPAEWPIRCVCGSDVVDFGDAVTCCGESCINPDYHLHCVGLTLRPSSWLCPTCKSV